MMALYWLMTIALERMDIIVNKSERKSIFQLERRLDLLEDFWDLYKSMDCYKLRSHGLDDKTLMVLLDEVIADWPYREGVSSIRSYLAKKNINLEDNDESAFSREEKVLYSLELYINLLHWVHESNAKNDVLTINLSNITLEQELKPFIDNIEYILERCNMRVREKPVKGNFPQYIIIKRDVNVDAVIEEVPELSDVLLSYLDIRNKNDEQAKREILKQIADYLEPKRKDYKSTAYSSLCDSLFVVFNKCNIRHNDKNQIKLRKPQRMKLYDQTFTAAIHLMQMESVNVFKETVNQLKKEC